MENKSTTNRNQFRRLAIMLCLGSLTGGITIAALAGLFKIWNFPGLAVAFFMGPGAFLSTIFLDGTLKERMITAFLAGSLATILAIFAAGFGPVLLSKLNINLLKITGGLAVLIIGLIIMGLQINDKIPLAIVALGIIAGFIWR